MRRPGRRWRRGAPPVGRGQATVELALLLPVVVVFALGIAQVALVAHARVMLTHSARERSGRRGGEGDTEVRAVVLAASCFDTSRVDVGWPGQPTRWRCGCGTASRPICRSSAGWSTIRG
ncbi:MAG: TadE/TadG family type IV pilus assembly protein [Acidimicrobiales bacterium]